MARQFGMTTTVTCILLSCLTLSATVRSEQGSGEYSDCSIDGRIRLGGGTTGFDGWLEICNNHVWSTVCYRGHYSNNNLARVACRQLGLSTSIGTTLIRPTDYSWTTNSPIIWSQLNCATPNELSIFNCNYSLNVSGCTHSLDIGISCGLPNDHCTPGLVHLQRGNSTNTVQGTVAMCVQRYLDPDMTYSLTEWINICGVQWDINDAVVVCRQLRLPTENVRIGHFGGGRHNIQMDNVHCTGIELNLSACGFRINRYILSDNLDMRCNNHSHNAAEVICGDTNECSLGTHNCDRNAVCVDVDNSYECHCREPLHVGNGTFCSKVDLCANESSHNCSIDNNEVCVSIDIFPGYRCDCRTGFVNETDTCIDFNECVKSPHLTNCTHRCINTLGSFYCECNPGYHLLDNSYECKDINECNNEADNECEQGCNNTESSYMCSCHSGYYLAQDGYSCIDIDECATNSSNDCAHICINIMGSYLCDCYSGHLLLADSSTCQDIDECANPETNECNATSTCSNTPGSYECVCTFPWNEPVDNFNCRLSATFLGGTIAGAVALSVVLFIGIFICCCTFNKMKSNTKKDQSKQISLSDHDGIVLHSKRGPMMSVSSDVELPPEILITSDRLKLLETIGQGEFGLVYKGKLKYGQAMTELVAVKTLKGLYDQFLVDKLLEECVKMHGLDHPNVLTLKGVCLDGGTAPFIILPFMKNGSLLSFLQKEKDTLFLMSSENYEDEIQSVTKQLMDISLQIARGMEFLAGKKLVHRDLAARNCMIDTHFTIKVADFGLAASTGSETEYFRPSKESGERLPIKWMAPESIMDLKFSEKSDIWAYGVTTWEIFSGGQAPYPGIKPVELKDLLLDGHRMEEPQNLACNDKMYNLMLSCWNLDPSDRPTFSQVVTDLSISLEEMAGYMDVAELVTTRIDSDSETESQTDSVFEKN